MLARAALHAGVAAGRAHATRFGRRSVSAWLPPLLCAAGALPLRGLATGVDVTTPGPAPRERAARSAESSVGRRARYAAAREGGAPSATSAPAQKRTRAYWPASREEPPKHIRATKDIDALLKGGDAAGARRRLAQLREDGGAPDLTLYRILLQARAARQPARRRASRDRPAGPRGAGVLRVEMARDGLRPDTTTANHVLMGLAEGEARPLGVPAGDLALQFLGSLEPEFGPGAAPDAASHNLVLAASFKAGDALGRRGEWGRAAAVAAAGAARFAGADDALHPYVAAFKGLKQWAGAAPDAAPPAAAEAVRGVLRSLASACPRPSEAIVDAAVDAMAAVAADRAAAAEAVEFARSSGQPSLFQFKKLAEHLHRWGGGGYEDAAWLLGAMRDAGVRPDRLTASYFTGALCVQKRPDDAVRILRELRDWCPDSVATPRVYNAIADEFTSAGRLSEAAAITVEGVHAGGVVPRYRFVASLLRALVSAGRADEAVALAAAAEQKGPPGGDEETVREHFVAIRSALVEARTPPPCPVPLLPVDLILPAPQALARAGQAEEALAAFRARPERVGSDAAARLLRALAQASPARPEALLEVLRVSEAAGQPAASRRAVRVRILPRPAHPVSRFTSTAAQEVVESLVRAGREADVWAAAGALPPGSRTGGLLLASLAEALRETGRPREAAEALHAARGAGTGPGPAPDPVEAVPRAGPSGAAAEAGGAARERRGAAGEGPSAAPAAEPSSAQARPRPRPTRAGPPPLPPERPPAEGPPPEAPRACLEGERDREGPEGPPLPPLSAAEEEAVKLFQEAMSRAGKGPAAAVAALAGSGLPLPRISALVNSTLEALLRGRRYVHATALCRRLREAGLLPDPGTPLPPAPPGEPGWDFAGTLVALGGALGHAHVAKHFALVAAPLCALPESPALNRALRVLLSPRGGADPNALYAALRRAGAAPDSRVLSLIVTTLVEARRAGEAAGLAVSALSDGADLPSDTLQSLATALGPARPPLAAGPAPAPSASAACALLEAAAAGLARRGRADEARAALARSAEGPRARPKGPQGFLESPGPDGPARAREVLDEMRAAGVAPTAAAYSQLVTVALPPVLSAPPPPDARQGCARRGALAEAESAYEKMVAAGLEPAERATGALVEALGAAGRHEAALAAFRRAQARRPPRAPLTLRPSSSCAQPASPTLSALLDRGSAQALVRARREEEARAVAAEMGPAGLEPTRATRRALAPAGRPAAAAATLLEAARAAGARPGPALVEAGAGLLDVALAVAASAAAQARRPAPALQSPRTDREDRAAAADEEAARDREAEGYQNLPRARPAGASPARHAVYPR
eukprot:tig00021501_g21944.t1